MEPGYAECADAIKSGVIKKVSVSHSHEKLDNGTDGKTKHDPNSEIYANPQILLRKRSRLLEEGSNEDDNEKGDKETVTEISVVKKNKKTDKKKRKQGRVEQTEAPPLPARNYSLYLENDEAETIVKEVLDDIEQENDGDVTKDVDDEAFNEISESVKSETDTGISRNEKDIKTSDLTNVSNSPESGVLSVQSCPTNKIEQSDHFEQVSSSGNLETKCIEEKSDCCETDEKGKDDDSECFHVTVKDKSGNEKVLRIVEKEESFKIKDKRKEIKEKCKLNKKDSCDKETESESSNVLESSANKCDTSNLNVKSETKDFKSDSALLLSDNSVSGCSDNSTKVCVESKEDDANSLSGMSNFDSTNVITDHAKDHDSHIIAISNDCSKTDNIQIVYTDTQNSKDETCIAGKCDSVDSNDSHANSGCANTCTSCSLDTFNSATYHMGLCQTNPEHGDLLGVHAVKMKSVSVDSDNSDFLDTSDLPKLEINESDLDNPFDSSDNSNCSGHELDIATESAAIDKLTNDLTHELEKSNKSDWNGDVDTDNRANAKSVESSTEIVVEEKIETSHSNNPDVDLTVVSPGSMKFGSFSESARTETEVSDDSAIENNDEDDKDESSLVDLENKTGCDNENMNTSVDMSKEGASKESDGSLSYSLSVSYEKKYPGLYEDNEPTHMSLEEVMDGSPWLSTVYKAHSPSDEDMGFDPFSSPNIPHSDDFTSDTPPPRPPPLSASQLQSRSFTSSQSSQSTVESGDQSPPFRFAYGSGLSDEEGPPALPPKIAERPKRRPGKPF